MTILYMELLYDWKQFAQPDMDVSENSGYFWKHPYVCSDQSPPLHITREAPMVFVQRLDGQQAMPVHTPVKPHE